MHKATGTHLPVGGGYQLRREGGGGFTVRNIPGELRPPGMNKQRCWEMGKEHGEDKKGESVKSTTTGPGLVYAWQRIENGSRGI